MISIQTNKSNIEGTINLPGSKSISNRYLMLNAVYGVDRELRGLSDSEDTELLKQALQQIHSGKLKEINVHHAGTDMRFLISLLACKKGNFLITGSERLVQRPVKDLVDALRVLGADITYLGEEGFPPLRIKGKNINGGELEMNGNVSSQFISSLLLSSPLMKNGIVLKVKGERVSWPYVEMTAAALREYGREVRITESANAFIIESRLQVPVPISYLKVEADWSSTSYWYSLLAMCKEGSLILSGLNSNSTQGDSVLPALYARLGILSVFKKDGSLHLSKTQEEISVFEYDFSDCPDIAQTLAVTCFGLGIEARLSGLSTLKIKETDRLLALKNEIERLGGEIEITDSSLHLLQRRKALTDNVTVKTYHDHRMAMAFAPLILQCGNLKFEDESVVKKSYPNFWAHLQMLI